MTDRELMQMALDALESWQKTCLDCGRASEELGRSTKPIKALRDRLAQPKRQWAGLTDDEIYDYADKFLYQHGSNYGIKSFGKSIEAKLKEKNT
jgi:hypothetical protein